MSTSSSSGASASIELQTEIKQKELAVIGPALNDFLTPLESPSANFLSVLTAAKNLQLSVLQLDGPAQGVIISCVATFLKAKLSAILTPAAAA